MDIRERFATISDAVEAAAHGIKASMWSSLPCHVLSVSADGQHADMQPSIQSIVQQPDGTTKSVNLPVLPSVPLHFPHGGGVSMTFPVKAGDEALVIFSSRPTDAWKQSGGIQTQIDARMHDLSDGFALVGFKSSPNALSNVSTSSTQLRSDDGEHVIDLHPGSGLTLSSKGSSISISEAGIAMAGPALTMNGVNISDTHVHGGVQPGGADTGTPE